MMRTVPRKLKQILYSIVLLLSLVSLSCTHREIKTQRVFQIFASEDDPSGRIAVDDEKIFRKRAAKVNLALLTEQIFKIRRGDKLVGYLFEDEYVEATVAGFRPISRSSVLLAEINGRGILQIMADGKAISLKADLKDTMRDYRCLYDREEAGYVVKEIESKQVARERREKAVAAAREAGPKTVQIFAEDDDPSNRMTWDETNDAFEGFVRKRKASVNPQLFRDRIEEIIIGDTLVGQLFEDEYFEGIITSQPEEGYGGSLILELKIIDDNNIANRILLISHAYYFYLHIVDKTRKKEFWVSSTENIPYHVVVERDPSKIKILEDAVGQSTSDNRKRAVPVSAYIFSRNKGGTDNWGEVKKLFFSDDFYGESGPSNAVSGDNAIAGAYLADGDYRLSGSAYLLSRNQGGADNWGKVKKLTASDASRHDKFGNFVAISGDYAIVGANRDDGVRGKFGSAYIYYRHQGGADNWGEVKKLTASDFPRGYNLVTSVDISGDYAIVGAYGYVGANNWSGSVYIYYRNHDGADNWEEVKKLTASDSSPHDSFGNSVAISSDYAVVGASGFVYVYYRNQGGDNIWGEVKKLTASDVFRRYNFGRSIAISGDYAMVGAYGDYDTRLQSGSAYVYYRNQGGADNWGEVKILTASDASLGDFFGASIAISGDYAIIGAYGYKSGSAYIFSRNQGGENNWGEIKKLTASDDFTGRFGMSVDIDGDYAIVSVETMITIAVP